MARRDPPPFYICHFLTLLHQRELFIVIIIIIITSRLSTSIFKKTMGVEYNCVIIQLIVIQMDDTRNAMGRNGRRKLLGVESGAKSKSS